MAARIKRARGWCARPKIKKTIACCWFRVRANRWELRADANNAELAAVFKGEKLWYHWSKPDEGTVPVSSFAAAIRGAEKNLRTNFSHKFRVTNRGILG